MPVAINKETQADAITLYQEGLSARAVGLKLGISHPACLAALRRAGVTRRDRHVARRRYHFREDAFSNVTTEAQAYWLGFITADGCVSDSRLILNLQEKDREHIAKFADFLGTSAPIARVSDRPAFAIHVCSNRILSDLASLGVGPRKSLTVTPWNGPVHLMRHYWRGLWDGDGWISHDPIRKEWQVGVCGSQEVMQEALAFARLVCGTTASLTRKNPIWFFKVGGRPRPRELVRALYEGSTISLDRKYESARKLLTYIRQGDVMS